MINKRALFMVSVCSMLLFCSHVWAQKPVRGTFYDTRIVNGHSIELQKPGTMKFFIGHRFGAVNSGFSELFGLDVSDVRLGLDFGIIDRLNIGFGRSSFEKTYDGYAKFSLLRQKSGGVPVSVTYLGSMALRTVQFPASDSIKNELVNKLFFSHQLLVGSKLNDRLSVQMMPTIVHRNLSPDSLSKNDLYALGLAGRYKLTKNIAIGGEYYFIPAMLLSPVYNNQSLAIGLDIDTKGHVFQLHFGNSRGMIEKFFIGETRGAWLDGDIRFGFNITRDFRIARR